MKLIQADWPAAKHVNAFTTTRQGGISQAPFAEFNLAHHVGDEEAAVQHNRKLLMSQLPNEPVWLQQIHSNTVVPATDKYRYSEADASVSHEKSQVCCVLTADCLPILLCDKAGTTVAAIHGGWRGLAKQIIHQTVSYFNMTTDQILAWLGPAIGPKCFIVGDDVKQAFINADKQHELAFTRYNDRWLANLYDIARQQLQQCGINNVYGGNYCSYTNKELFYSYRRDGQTGRMASLIWLS